tara:strand:- start:350 stop:550 length:201 start_codon:yes stop_codon:yes gene_type:complete
MELTEENVIKVLEELLPYIEADGGWLEFVEIEHETNFVKGKIRWCMFYLCNECYNLKARYRIKINA